MKKHVFLFIFAIMALFGNAQTAAPHLFFPGVDTVNDVSTLSIAASAQGQNITGAWHAKLQVQHIDSTVWLNSDIGNYSMVQTLTTRIIDSLTANTWYRVRFVAYNFDYSDSFVTPQVYIVHTKILPQQVTIANVTTVPMLPKSGLRLTATAYGHPLGARAYAKSNTFPFPSVTDTLPVYNSTTDTIFFLNNIQGTPYPDVTVFVEAIDGSSSAWSGTIGGFYPPSNTGPTLVKDTVMKGVNSAETVVNVTSIGNTGPCVLITEVKDSITGTSVNTPITQNITAPGLFHTQLNPLASNHTYTVTQRLVNGLSLGDTIVYSFKTKNVNPPVINAVANSIEDYYTYRVNVPVNANNTYGGDSAKVVKVRIYEGLNWVLIDSAVTSISDTATIHLDELNKTPGNNYTVKVQAENAAGLLSNAVTLTVHTKSFSTNAAPYVDDMIANSASDLMLTGFIFHVGSGNTVDCAYVLRDITDNHVVDTTYLAHGVTSDISFQSHAVTNLTGNHAYSVTPITIGANGIVEGNTLVQVMPAPNEFPTAGGLSQHATTDPATELTVTGFGSGEGNACTVTFHLVNTNTNVHFDTIVAPGTWSGDIDFTASWIHLNQGTTYKVIMDIVAPTGKAAQAYAYYTTTGTATGIEEVKVDNIDETDVRVFNTIGQILAVGKYKTVYGDLRGKGPVFVEFTDENGKHQVLHRSFQ
jgi:hypothetical protein